MEPLPSKVFLPILLNLCLIIIYGLAVSLERTRADFQMAYVCETIQDLITYPLLFDLHCPHILPFMSFYKSAL